MSFVSTRATPFLNSENPLNIADLSIWIVFDFIYVFLTILCLLPIRRIPSQKEPFIVLFCASFCTIIQSSLSIAYTTYINVAVNANGSSSFLHRAGSLYSASLFFAHWASTLLFLAIVLVLFDGQKYIKYPISPRASVLVPRMCIGWSVLLFIASTVDACLTVAALNESRTGSASVALEGFQDDTHTQQGYEIIQYILAGLWFIGGLLISAFAACVYASAWLTGVTDKIINLTVCLVAPLCILGILEDIAFKLVLVPSFTLGVPAEEPLSLVNNILFNVFRSAILIVLITMGLRQEHHSQPVIRAQAQERYSELVDAPILK